jgi:mono/diheme cytochrome c family protein
MPWSIKAPLAIATMLLGATASAAEPPFPLDDATRIEAGRRRFARTCAAYCHGAEGSGGRAPAFKGSTRLTPDYAFQTITEGRRGTDVMPPWGNAFTPEQIWELVAYLQVLSRMPPD